MSVGVRRVLKRPAALLDLIEQATFIANDRPAIGSQFLSSVEHAFETLSETPGIGSSRPYLRGEFRDLRVWPVPGFPKVLIFYRFDDERVEIIRILHGSRDLPSVLGE